MSSECSGKRQAFQNPGREVAPILKLKTTWILRQTAGCEDDKLTGGAERDRTADLLNAIQALSQLSYSPDLYISYTFTPDIVKKPGEQRQKSV